MGWGAHYQHQLQGLHTTLPRCKPLSITLTTEPWRSRGGSRRVQQTWRQALFKHTSLSQAPVQGTQASHIILCDAPLQCTRFSLRHFQHCFCTGAIRWGYCLSESAPVPIPHLFHARPNDLPSSLPACTQSSFMVTSRPVVRWSPTDVLFSKGHSRGVIACGVQEAVMSKTETSTA